MIQVNLVNKRQKESQHSVQNMSKIKIKEQKQPQQKRISPVNVKVNKQTLQKWGIKKPEGKFYMKKRKLPRFHGLPYGKLRVRFRKRNMFLTLSDSKGLLKTNISCGFNKVKGRKLQSLHIVKKTGRLIVKQILKHNLKNLVYESVGRTFNKKRRTILHIFSRIRQFRFIHAYRPSPRSHNGCRPKKPRRK